MAWYLATNLAAGGGIKMSFINPNLIQEIGLQCEN